MSTTTPSPLLRVLSFGGGVQSSTLDQMIWEGEFSRPDAVIFADTGWETPATYANVDYRERQCQAHGIDFRRVSNGNIRKDSLRSLVRARVGDRDEEGREARFASLPFYTRDKVTGEVGILRRQCTKEYKVEAVNREIRRLLGLQPRQRAPIGAAEVWLCITTDELARVALSRDRWRINRYPLIEKRMSRHDCARWSERHGYPEAPRSACIGCPFRTNAEWQPIRQDPALWKDAVEFDAAIRRKGGARGDLFLHRAAVPLPMVDLSTPEERGQLNLFRDECQGMCGV